MTTTLRAKPDAAAVAAVDEARAALSSRRRRRRRGRPPRPRRRGRAGGHPPVRLHPPRLRRLALVGDRGPGAPPEAGHRRRGRAGARRRGDRGAGVGALQGAGPARRPVARATCCPSRTTTRGWCRPGPSATTRSTPTTRPRSAQVAQDLGLGRVRTLSLEGRDLAAAALVRRRRRPEAPLAKSAPDVCSTCGFLVRLAGPLSDAVRGLRQRQRQRRRQGGLARPRLRRPLRGPAGQEARAAADAARRSSTRSTSTSSSASSRSHGRVAQPAPREQPDGVVVDRRVQLVAAGPQVDAQAGRARRRRRTPRAGTARRRSWPPRRWKPDQDPAARAPAGRGAGPARRRSVPSAEEDHHVADQHDEVELRRMTVLPSSAGVQRRAPSLGTTVEVGIGAPRLLDQRRVGLDGDDPVPAGRSASGTRPMPEPTSRTRRAAGHAGRRPAGPRPSTSAPLVDQLGEVPAVAAVGPAPPAAQRRRRRASGIVVRGDQLAALAPAGAGGSTPGRRGRARSRPGRSTATTGGRRPRAGRRTAAARGSRAARAPSPTSTVRTPSTSSGSTSATM